MPRRKDTVASAHFDLIRNMIAALIPGIIGAGFCGIISAMATKPETDFTRFNLPIILIFGGASVIMMIFAIRTFYRRAEEYGE